MPITIEGTVNDISLFIKKAARTVVYPFFRAELFVNYLVNNYNYFVEGKTVLLAASFVFYLEYQSGTFGFFGAASKASLVRILRTLKHIQLVDAALTIGPYAIGVFFIFKLVAWLLTLRDEQHRLLVFRIGIHFFSAYFIVNFLAFMLFSAATLIHVGDEVMDYLYAFTFLIMPISTIAQIQLSQQIVSDVKFWKILVLMITGMVIFFINCRPFQSQENFKTYLFAKEDAGNGNLNLLDLDLNDTLLHVEVQKVSIDKGEMKMTMNVLLENKSDFLCSVQKTDYITLYTEENKKRVSRLFWITNWEDKNAPVLLIQPNQAKWISFSSDTLNSENLQYDTLATDLHFDFPRLRKPNDKGVGFLHSRTFKKQIVIEEDDKVQITNKAVLGK